MSPSSSDPHIRLEQRDINEIILWIKWFLQVLKTIWKTLIDIGYSIRMTARCEINSTRRKTMEAMLLTLVPLVSQVH